MQTDERTQTGDRGAAGLPQPSSKFGRLLMICANDAHSYRPDSPVRPSRGSRARLSFACSVMGWVAMTSAGVVAGPPESARDPERTITVVALQAGRNHSKNGNPGSRANFDCFAEQARAAAAIGPDLIVFPEYALIGSPYPSDPVVHGLAEPIPGEGPWYRLYVELAKEIQVPILGAVVESENGRIYNCAVMLDAQGEFVGKYRKVHANLGEQTWFGFSQGESFQPVELNGVRYGFSICSDMWHPETILCGSLLGADVILHQSIADDMQHLVPARAFDNHLPVVMSIFQGGSYAVDASGKFLGKLAPEDPGWKAFELKPYERHIGRKYGGLWDIKKGGWNVRNPAAYGILVDPSTRSPWTEIFFDKLGRPQSREDLLKRFGGRYDVNDPERAGHASLGDRVPSVDRSPRTSALSAVEQYGVHEVTLRAAGRTDNPYVHQSAEAVLLRPDGGTWSLPLFWDGGDTWKLRVSPDVAGEWSFVVRSHDEGLDGTTGRFLCTASDRRGSIEPMADFPHHFQYQNGEPMWFLGDTAWALFTDDEQERHNRAAAEYYLQTRASQGFNVIHAMVLSEAAWGNSGGLPFSALSGERLNPEYWQEVDERVAVANEQGFIVGLAIAWADKGKANTYAWRQFPDLDARKRYARYIAARYSAYDVYFLVAGEWNIEIRARDASEDEVRQEFIEIGDALADADPHRRMKAIHPATASGSVREFNESAWMSFGDYQQNYRNLNARILKSRRFNKPVVNAEYGYHLRDREGDGRLDKDNSSSTETIRHASWDIVMGGGYLVTGFGTTYFGGHRDPGPFDVDASKNDDWEEDVQHVKKLFTSLDWWRLEPHDELITSSVERGGDEMRSGVSAPPAITYWALADPPRQYVFYMRGHQGPYRLSLGQRVTDDFQLTQFNPRSGASSSAGRRQINEAFEYTPPDHRDWVLIVTSYERE